MKSNLEPKIIYEDKYFLILNKPSGLVVHPGNGVKEKYTLVDWIKKQNYYNKKLLDNYRFGIVHRLDKDTSGLMIIAKNRGVVNYFKNLFKNRQIIKKYKTLVFGNVFPKTDLIIASIGRKPSDKKKMTAGRGKYAKTKYWVIKKYKYGKYVLSYLKIRIYTGRTHQIRVHLKSKGWYILGDKIYSKQKLRLLSNKIGVTNLFLQSYYLEFKHPVNDKIIKIKIKTPNHNKNVLNTLSIAEN